MLGWRYSTRHMGPGSGDTALARCLAHHTCARTANAVCATVSLPYFLRFCFLDDDVLTNVVLIGCG